MMLESLFARAGQEQAFLYLTGCGFLFGMLLHLSGIVRRGRRILGAVCDAVAALALAGMLLMILLHFGGGVRAYGLLGLLIGLLLYYAGLSRLVEAVLGVLEKLLKRLQKTQPQKAGIRAGDAEVINTDDTARKE